MPAVTLGEMLAVESAAKARGWSEEQLLDEAGTQLGIAISRFFPHSGTALAYLGKGHNAGDAVVALDILKKRYGWKIGVKHAFTPDQWAPLLTKKCAQLGPVEAWDTMPDWQTMARPLVVIDGLLGCGGRGALTGKLLEFSREIEDLRHHSGARVAAVDLPSGLHPDTGLAVGSAITADITFMIAHAKHGLLSGSATNHTGALAVVPVASLSLLSGPLHSDLELISPQTMDFGKSPRRFDFHKGMAGRVSIIAGSTRYPGAAVLAATGALRGGGGLVTLHVPGDAHAMIAAKCPAEIMVRSYRSLSEMRNEECDAWVIGCGIGPLPPGEVDRLIELVSHHRAPAVLDADALNAIAAAGKSNFLRNHHIITPHPGEFRRLAPHLADLDREQAARAFVADSPATLLLKGSRTLIARKSTSLWCNSTGSPAMATGGQGDLLAGVIGAKLALGMAPMEAAALGAWACGRAAELALAIGGASEESLTPSDVARHLGRAFDDWRSSWR